MGDSWIDFVIARARELREAGVLSISCDRGAVTFAPMLEAAPVGTIDKPDASVGVEYDALTDPASYPGGVVPGFVIEKLEMED